MPPEAGSGGDAFTPSHLSTQPHTRARACAHTHTHTHRESQLRGDFAGTVAGSLVEACQLPERYVPNMLLALLWASQVGTAWSQQGGVPVGATRSQQGGVPVCAAVWPLPTHAHRARQCRPTRRPWPSGLQLSSCCRGTAGIGRRSCPACSQIRPAPRPTAKRRGVAAAAARPAGSGGCWRKRLTGARCWRGAQARRCACGRW